MAGKVAELINLQDKDSLGAEIAMRFQSWNQFRATKVAEWKELRNYIFATDTRTTTNSKNGWNNSTTIPKLTQIRDNLHANYRAALFSSDDWLKWEGNSQDDVIKEKANVIEDYIKNKLNNNGFEETIDKLLYDFIDYGNAFSDIIFVNEEKELDSGEIVQGYVGAKLVRISPYDIVFNPTAPSFKESPKIIRMVKTIGELKEELVSRPDLNYLEEAISKADEYRNAIGGFKTEDVDKSEGYLVDGFGSLSDYYQSGYVEILEFQGDLHDLDTGEFLKDYIITIIDRKWVLRKEKNPSWLGKPTQEHIGWRERTDNLYAMGALDNLVGMQYRLDHLENLKADALDLTIRPPLKIIGDVPPFEWSPNSTIMIPDADGDVIPMPPNPIALQVNNEIMYLQQMMEEMVGAPKQVMGVSTPGEKTAFEVQKLDNASGRIFQDKISRFEKYFVEPLLNTFLEVSRRNMDGAEIVRTIDDDLGVVEFLTITKEDITALGKLKPVGARHFSSQAQFIQNVNGIFNSPIGQMIMPHVSAKRMGAMVEELFGLEKFDLIEDNIGIIEQGETQKMMNATQQGVDENQAMSESQIDQPIEEEL